MTKLVSNIEIDSLVLERQRDENTENILNSLVVSSVDMSPLEYDDESAGL